MHKRILIITLALALLTGCTSAGVGNEKTNSTVPPTSTTQSSNANANSAKVDKYSQAPAELPADQITGKQAIIHTAKGDIKVVLFADTPKTTSNFISLSNDKFYDNLTFHRREEGFVIQGGDPSGDGTGGPGYTVPAEFTGHQHTRGAVAMARLGDAGNPTKASSGSQFYICLGDSHFLDGQYTVFGQVTDQASLAVVDQIKVGDTILSVTITNQ